MCQGSTLIAATRASADWRSSVERRQIDDAACHSVAPDRSRGVTQSGESGAGALPAARPRDPAVCAGATPRRRHPESGRTAFSSATRSVVKVRRLEARDVALVASIDRSEHVEVQYRVEHGHLVEGPVPASMVEIPPWDPDGSGAHSVASHTAFYASVVAEGAALFGAFDDDGEVLGLASVNPTFEPGLAWFAALHVSRAHRRRGVASALWDACAALAREAGARSLYVSATPTGSAVGFYLGRGCRLADPVHPALFADEPEDIHLVCPLDG
jgi:GNAT superfamily N-acetyltransferase